MATILPPRADTPYAIISPATGSESLLSIDRSEIQETYKRFGAILFRGFDLSLDTFALFANTFCSAAALNLSPNRDVLDGRNRIQTVDRGTEPFPLHPELSREPWKPDVCFFASMKPRIKGGETTICDGIEIVRNMRPRLLGSLQKRRLMYALPLRANEAKFWLKKDSPTRDDLDNPPADCPFKFAIQGNRVIRYFTVPVLHIPMFVDKLAFGNFLLFARYYHANRTFPCFANGEQVPQEVVEQIKQISDDIICPIEWEKDDVLMLDNTRFMHGRNRVFDLGRRQIATYFGYLNFATPTEDDTPNPVWREPEFELPFT